MARVPEVAVQDEHKSGLRQQYCVVPKIYENFYAISAQKKIQSEVLKNLLSYPSDQQPS